MSWIMGEHMVSDEQVQKAKYFGLSQTTVRTRICKLNWDIERAVTESTDPGCKPIKPWVIDTYTLTEEQMCTAFLNGISKVTLRKRINEPPFWNLDDALSTPVRGYKKRGK